MLRPPCLKRAHENNWKDYAAQRSQTGIKIVHSAGVSLCWLLVLSNISFGFVIKKRVLHVLYLYRWFQLGTNPHTGTEDWLYTGGYFDRNYTDCPNIYWRRRCTQCEDLLSDRIHFISQHLRFVSSWRPDAHWYCVFVWVDEKLISKCYQTVYQIMTVNLVHRRNLILRRILEFTYCKCWHQTSSSLYALIMILIIIVHMYVTHLSRVLNQSPVCLCDHAAAGHKALTSRGYIPPFSSGTQP